MWEKFWQPLPPLGFTDIFALVKQKLMRVEGDLHPFMANLLYFKDVIAAPRKEAAMRHAMSTRFEPITGRYCISICSASRTGSMSRRPARAFRFSACTPPAPTRGNIAA